MAANSEGRVMVPRWPVCSSTTDRAPGIEPGVGRGAVHRDDAVKGRFAGYHERRRGDPAAVCGDIVAGEGPRARRQLRE